MGPRRTLRYLFLGRTIVFHLCQPHPLLRPFVRCYWAFEGGAGVPEDAFKVLPDGCMELIINMGDPYRRNGLRQPDAFVVGQITAVIELQPTGVNRFFSIRFEPHGLRPFIAMPVNELTDLDVSLEHLWTDAAMWTDQWRAAPDFGGQCAVADHFLTTCLARGISVETRLFKTVYPMLMQPDRSVAQIAAMLGLSARQLQRRFRDHTGLTPKHFARIARLRRVLAYLRDDDRFETLTDLAHDLGYSDQAHMNHDFKALTGLAPRRFAACRDAFHFDTF